MAILYVQDFNGAATSAANPTVAATLTVGNDLVVFVSWVTAVGSITSVTDLLGNTYTAAGAIRQGNGFSVQGFTAKVTTGGATTITANLSANQTSAIVSGFEFSGA